MHELPVAAKAQRNEWCVCDRVKTSSANADFLVANCSVAGAAPTRLMLALDVGLMLALNVP